MPAWDAAGRPVAFACRRGRGTPLPEFLAATGIAEHSARSLAAVGQALAAAGRGHRSDDPGAGRRHCRGLDWRFRLAVQTAVAATMVACGWCVRLPWDVPGVGLCGERGVDRGPREFVQHARQHGRLVGRRGGDRRGDSGGGRPLDAAARQSPAATFRGRFPAAVRRFLAGISRAQSAAGPAVHGRCRQLLDRLPAGDGHAHGDLCRRRPAATPRQAGTRGPWRRCA